MTAPRHVSDDEQARDLAIVTGSAFFRPITVEEHRLAAAGGDPEKAERTQLIIDGRARICGSIVHDRVLPPNEHVARANRKQRRHLAKQRRAGVL